MTNNEMLKATSGSDCQEMIEQKCESCGRVELWFEQERFICEDCAKEKRIDALTHP